MSTICMDDEAVLEFISLASEVRHAAQRFQYFLWLYKQSRTEDKYWLESLPAIDAAIKEIIKLANDQDYVEFSIK